jgi:hypothetical protein
VYEGGKDTVDSGKLSRRGKLEHDDHENEDGEGSSRKNVLKLSFSFIQDCTSTSTPPNHSTRWRNTYLNLRSKSSRCLERDYEGEIR